MHLFTLIANEFGLETQYHASVKQQHQRVSLVLAMAQQVQFSFDGQSIAARVQVLAPIVNSMIEDHDSGTSAIGVEAFQEDLTGRMKAAGLMEQKWLKVDAVGVHPDNREKSMVVPIDMHDLLRRMAQDGWNWSKWEALACEIPATEEGKNGGTRTRNWRRPQMDCWPLPGGHAFCHDWSWVSWDSSPSGHAVRG